VPAARRERAHQRVQLARPPRADLVELQRARAQRRLDERRRRVVAADRMDARTDRGSAVCGVAAR
jgi:hypothetical protein